MSRALLRFSALWALCLVLAGCFSNERVAGGDDIPNSVEPVGRQGAQETSDSSGWNAYGDAPSSAPGVYDTTRIPDAPPEENAPTKRSSFDGILPGLDAAIGTDFAGADRTLFAAAFDSLAGSLRAVRVQIFSGSSFRAEDTTWYKLDSLGMLRLVKVSGFVELDGAVRRAAFTDGDGDGFLSARAGTGGVAVVRIVTVSSSGERQEEESRVSSGPDGDFNARGDNTVMAWKRNVTQGPDTLLSLFLRDGDGDGILFNPFSDSNKVEVEARSVGAGGAVEVLYALRIYGDSSRNYAYSYGRKVSTALGVTETRALGRDSSFDYAPGDTGSVQVTFAAKAATDSLASYVYRYKVALSDTAGRASGNRLLEVKRAKVFGRGVVSASEFRLVPAASVPGGSFARFGAVDLHLDFRAGGSVSFAGESKAEGISGTYSDSNGKSGAVRFNTAGGIVHPR